MAFKIVYGAGETLSLGSEGKFGAGYGFLEMHRDERVKKFARDVLERRLMGNSYGFERGKEWKEDERIEISSFQRCGEWYVLSRLRPISESRGRAYFLAEFLLIDESEAKALAAMRGEGSNRGVLPVDILLLEKENEEEIWFSGELWDRPGRWLEDSIDLCPFLSAKEDWTYYNAPRAFSHRECVWETERSTEWTPKGWKPRNVLEAMASTQNKFLDGFGSRCAFGTDAVNVCFDLAWNSISLTNFYLDPKSGIDLLIGEKKGVLPYTWTGVFGGIPMHDAIRQEGERTGILVKTAHPEGQKEVGDEEKMISSGWIRPAPALAPEQAPAQVIPLPGSEPPRRGQPVAHAGTKVSVKRSVWPKRIFLACIAVAAVLVLAYGWFLYSNHTKVNEVYKELGDAQRSGNASEVIRLMADRKIGTELKSEKFQSYLNFSKQFPMLQSYLEKAGETKPAELLTADFTTSAGSSKDLALLQPTKTLWQFARENDGLLKAEPANRMDRLFKIRDRFAAWQDEDRRVELARAASLCGWQNTWKKYEAVMPVRNLSRLQTLVDEEEAKRAKSEGKDSDDDIKFREELLKVIKDVEKREPKDRESWRELASLLSRANTLTIPPVVETPPVPKPEEPVKQAPKAKGILTMAHFVQEGAEKPDFYAFPKVGFTDVYLADPAMLRDALKGIVWQGNALRMPVPVIETTDGLGKVTATSSKVFTPVADVGIVDSTKDSLFKFGPLKDDDEPFLAFVAKNTAEGHECWIYLRETFEQSLSIGPFIDSPPIEEGAMVANLDSAKVTIIATHPNLGEVTVHPEEHGSALGDAKKLGNLLLVRSGRVAKEIADYEGLMSLKPAVTAFRKWFKGEEDAPATPASTFCAGVADWSEDKVSGSVAVDNELAINRFNAIQSWQQILRKPDPGSSQPEKTMLLEEKLVSYVVNLSAVAVAKPPKPANAEAPHELAYFLPSEDPLHILSRIPVGERTIENLAKKLATALLTYDPKAKPLPVPPDPPVDDKKGKDTKGNDKENKAEAGATPESPAKKPETPAEKLDRLADEARVKNGIAMKKNWENFLTDLVEMEKFVKWFGTTEVSETTVAKAMEVIDQAKGKKEALQDIEATLRGGDLSGVEFKLKLEPTTK